MKDLKYFVFIEKEKNIRINRKFIGIVKPNVVRWALARKYNWFEQSFSKTLAEIENLRITSNNGTYDYKQVNQIIVKFIEANQTKKLFTNDPTERWVKIEESDLWENADWITGQTIKDIIGDDFSFTLFNISKFNSALPEIRTKMLIQTNIPYIALVDDYGNFEKLIDRKDFVEKLLYKYFQNS